MRENSCINYYKLAVCHYIEQPNFLTTQTQFILRFEYLSTHSGITTIWQRRGEEGPIAAILYIGSEITCFAAIWHRGSWDLGIRHCPVTSHVLSHHTPRHVTRPVMSHARSRHTRLYITRAVKSHAPSQQMPCHIALSSWSYAPSRTSQWRHQGEDFFLGFGKTVRWGCGKTGMGHWILGERKAAWWVYI